MTNLTPKNKRVNKKSLEIQRFVLFMQALGLKAVDIANKTEFSERTINNFIWQDMPISGQLLRELHLNFNLSVDWLLAGKGPMLLDMDQGDKAGAAANDAENKVLNARAERMLGFVNQFMATASEDEQVWLEMQLKLHVPQYVKFLEQQDE